MLRGRRLQKQAKQGTFRPQDTQVQYIVRLHMMFWWVTAPIAGFAAYWALFRKAYKIDKQGRYVALDLNRPKLPFMFASLNAVGTFIPQKRLEAEVLIEKAQKQAGGLQDFGDEERLPFRDGLERVLSAANNCKLLTYVGRMSLEQYIVQVLCNRLLQEDLIKRHPEILEEEIPSPVFIVGLPRSGTTHLHRCLGQIEGFRTLKLHEIREPIMTREVLDGYERGIDIRMEKYEKLAENLKVRALILVMHEMEVHEAEEHHHLSAGVFRSMAFLLFLPGMEYVEWYDSIDATVEYEYTRRCLQVIQWQDAQLGKPRKTFLLKNTQDIQHIDALKKTFPDARLVHIYRDLIDTLISGIFLMALVQGITSTNHLEYYRDLCMNWFEKRLGEIDWGALRKGSCYVDYKEFVADNVGTVIKVCECLGVEVSDQSIQTVRDYTAKTAEKKRGRVFYDMSLLGLSEQEMRDRFGRFAPDLDAVKME